MPELTYNLASGVNQDNLLNLRLDTQERMRDLYEGFNVPKYQPPQHFIPKHFDTDTLVGGDIALPTLREALYSKDPAVARAAAEQARYIASKDPTATGLGMQNKVKYQEGQDKFTDNHWWKENNQTMYGFNPYKSIVENEDFLHKQLWDNYSLPGKIWRGVGTFAGRTLSKLVTGLVGAVGDIGSMAWNGLQEVGDLMNVNDGTKNNFWEDVSNNWLSRKMTEADDYVKNSILPVYKSLDYDNKGAWAKLLDPHTWQTSFADGAGFLLQFAVPGAAFGKAAQTGKLARSIGEFSTLEELAVVAPQTAQKIAKAGMTIEQAKNVSSFTKLMGLEISDATAVGRFTGRTAEFLTGSKNVGGISAHVFNTTLESVAETKEGFDRTVEDLMIKGMSREEAVKLASENAPSQFWINMGILTASNAFENKLLQKAIGNRGPNLLNRLDDGTLLAEKQATTKLNKFFENNKWGNRIKYYGQNSIKASFFEGYWEENAQTAAQRWARGEYERQGDDTGKGSKKEITESGLSGFFKQLYNQTIDAAKGNDREAADSIMAGAVIGVLGMGAFAKISGERKQQQVDKSTFIANLRNNRDAWLSLNTLSPDIYDNEGKIIPEKAKEKAAEIAEKLDKMGSVFKKTVTGESLVDPQDREILQHRVFADYVKAHIMNGTEQQLIKKLQGWSVKSSGELSMYGVTEELKQDSNKWAGLAKDLVDEWNKIKDIKYSAPKTETVESYFSKTEALKSLIFDYVALKNMSETLATKYADLKDEVNPFSKFPQQQPYNEKQAQIMALKASLEKEEVPVVREVIQAKIDSLEKEQKDTRKSIFDLGETKEDGTGFLIPKGIDSKSNPIDFKDVTKYLDFQFHQTDHENAVKTHEKLIEDYSDPRNGIENWNKVVDYWSKETEKVQQDIQDKKETKETKDTVESLNKELEQATVNSQQAKTEEEKKIALDKIDEIEKRKKDILDAVGKEEDEVEDKDLSVINEEVTKVPTEEQLGHQPLTSEALAWETPFKTANKETRNITLENGDTVYWKENVLEHSYDHDLTDFIKTYSKEIGENPERYEAFVIKDTDEFLEQRLSEKQLELWKAGGNQLGAIVVFKEKGKAGWVKMEDRKGTPIVAFSFNKVAFEDQKDVRASIRADKTGVDIPTALKFYEEQQSIADKIRQSVIANPSLQVPVKADLGSLGIFPTTSYLENAFKRFEGFTDGVVRVVKDINDFTGDVSLGQTLLEIPKDKTDSKLAHYIPLTTGHLTENTTLIGIRIYQSVQAINLAKFDTKEEAALIVQSFLKNLFYTSDIQYFRIIQDGSKFKISYYKKNPKTGEVTLQKSYTNLKLKFLESLYTGAKRLSIYEKDPQTGKFISSEIDANEYKEFIHNSLNTNRKLLTVVRNKKEYVYTKKVNGYLNLTQIGEGVKESGEAVKTTEEAIQPIAPPDVVARQDIERRRQGLNGIEEIIFSNPNFRIEGFEIDGNYWNVVTSTDRAKVLVNINGVIVPFYLTTGQAGKGLVPGWYPFFGIGKDGWLNKTDKSDMETYYERYWGKETADIVKSISKELNSFYGTDPTTFKNDGDPNATSRPLTTLADKVEDYISSKLNYTPAINDANARKTLRSNVEQLGKEINAKYDTELAALDKKEEVKEEPKKEIPKDLEDLIRRKKDALEKSIESVRIGIENANTPNIKEILEKQGKQAIERLQKELDDLLVLVPKKDEEQSPLDKLRTKVALSQPMETTSAVTTIKVNRKEYRIDFENSTFLSASTITPTDIENLNEFFEKAHAYEFKVLNINGKSVYLVKYNKIGKFVILDENFKITSENKELLENEEYKKFKNCE